MPRARRAFTLAEVLAAMLLMAIVIPVALGGMRVASRVAVVEQRKAAAQRVAERVLNELIATNQLSQASAAGTQADGDTTYPWAMETQPWAEDAMTQMTVRVSFTVESNTYETKASTLFDPSTTTS